MAIVRRAYVIDALTNPPVLHLSDEHFNQPPAVDILHRQNVQLTAVSPSFKKLAAAKSAAAKLMTC